MLNSRRHTSHELKEYNQILVNSDSNLIFLIMLQHLPLITAFFSLLRVQRETLGVVHQAFKAAVNL